MAYKRISGMPVSEGGTGNTTLTTAYGVLCAGTTATGAVQTLAALGASGTVLTSNGAGALPSFQASSGGVTSITGTANQITASASTGAVTLSIPSTFIAPGSIEATTTVKADTNFLLPSSTSTAGNINFNGVTQFQVHGTSNVWIGDGAGNYTSTGSGLNQGIGHNALAALTNGNSNTAIGDRALTANTTGSNNIAIGNLTLQTCTTSIENIAIGDSALNKVTTGTGQNIGIGADAAAAITTGSNNIAIGYLAGLNWTSTESNNVYLSTARGTAAESNVIRIGFTGTSNTSQQTSCFIDGIYNQSNSGTKNLAVVDSVGKLGSSTTTSVTGSLEMSSFIKADTVFNTPTTTSTVGQYQINGSAVLHTFGTGLANTFVGLGAGNFTLGASEHNTAVGSLAGASLNGATGHNTYIGYQAGTLDDGAGGSSVAVGHNAYSAFTGATVAHNTGVGADSLLAVVNGRRNTAIGYSSGSALTTNDSDNICIGAAVTGTAGDNNKLTIGAGTGTGNGQLNKAFISGIQTITVTGTAVLVSTADQLGVAASSRRYKENIHDLHDTRVLDLRPVSFNYTVGEDHSPQTGLIAEEVFDVIPELVVLDKEGLPQTVKYHDLPVLLLSEMKKMAIRISQLEEFVNGNK